MDKFIDLYFDPCYSLDGVVPMQLGDVVVSCDLREIYKNSVLLRNVASVEPDDLVQGRLGDCWLLSALSSVARKDPDKIRECFTCHDPLQGYTVIKFGSFETVVDHRVPLVLDCNGRLKSNPCPKLTSDGEYWPILLEKAFVKYFFSSVCPEDARTFNFFKRLNCGTRNVPSYVDVNGGFPRWVYQALYGVKPLVEGTNTPGRKWSRFFADTEEYKVMACACTSPEFPDSVVDKGYVYGHAYTVIASDPDLKLIRLRNPWGHTEPTTYGDNRNDGEFWISEDEFKARFMQVCSLRLSRV